MADLLFVAITIAFFGIALATVKLCDRIIGPDVDAVTELDAVEPDRDRGAPGPGEYAEPIDGEYAEFFDEDTLTVAGARR